MKRISRLLPAHWFRSESVITANALLLGLGAAAFVLCVVAAWLAGIKGKTFDVLLYVLSVTLVPLVAALAYRKTGTEMPPDPSTERLCSRFDIVWPIIAIAVLPILFF